MYEVTVMSTDCAFKTFTDASHSTAMVVVNLVLQRSSPWHPLSGFYIIPES